MSESGSDHSKHKEVRSELLKFCPFDGTEFEHRRIGFEDAGVCGRCHRVCMRWWSRFDDNKRSSLEVRVFESEIYPHGPSYLDNAEYAALAFLAGGLAGVGLVAVNVWSPDNVASYVTACVALVLLISIGMAVWGRGLPREISSAFLIGTLIGFVAYSFLKWGLSLLAGIVKGPEMDLIGYGVLFGALGLFGFVLSRHLYQKLRRR